MPLVQELLNGGLVTARDPILLKEGELQQADDMILRPRDVSVWKAPGRTRYGAPSGASATVCGLGYMSFDGNSDLLLARTGTTLSVSPFTGTTGTFSAVAGALANNPVGAQFLDTIQYANAQYVLQPNERIRRFSYITPPTTVTVTGCTLNSAGNVTHPTNATAFATVIVGQYVTCAGNIPAGASVLAKVSSSAVNLGVATTAGTGLTLVFTAQAFVSSRFAGLAPVGVFEVSQVTTVAGSWSSASDMGAGYYWFLYTEMYLPGAIDSPSQGFVESGFVGTARVGHITATATDAIAIARSNVVNNGVSNTATATHWQVYMSDRNIDSAITPSLATFRRIGGPIAIATATFTFKDAQTSQGPNLANAYVNPSSYPAGFLHGTLAAFAVPDGWKNQTSPSVFAVAYGTDASILLKNFNFADDGLTPLGVEVRIGTLNVSNQSMGVAVWLRTLDNSKITQTYMHTLGGTWGGSEGPVYLGSATDTWSPNIAWTSADFTNANFALQLNTIGVCESNRYLLGVDAYVTVYYTGTTVNRAGVFFKVVTLSSQAGVSIAETANLPPPNATTGDIFDGQLVLNNPANPAMIKYSLPDFPEYFPVSYYINFESKRKDIVTCIKRVGNVLVVGMQIGIKRVNYLPRETDAEFDRGRSQEDIATDHGIAGPLAATLFDMPGTGGLLAYVSYKGIHVTNGITTSELNTDLDWTSLFNMGLDSDGTPYMQRCVLVNYPSEYSLRLAYVPAGDTKVSKYLQFSYHPMHIKGMEMPAMGPCSMLAASFCSAFVGGASKIISGHQTDGYVYVEDSGTTSEDATTSIVPALTTRWLLPRGVGGQGRIQRVYLRVGTAGTSTTGGFTVAGKRQNTNEAVVAVTPTIPLNSAVGGTCVAHLDMFGETLAIQISKTNAQTSAFRLSNLAYQVEDGGQESHRNP